jgi:hypothetical protein
LASILRGTGGGALAAPELFSSGPAPATQLVADLNNDGLLDIVTGSQIGVSALLNTTAAPIT